MSIGEVSILTCAADYAYGERGSPPKIPANATLEFEVELLDFDTDDYKILGEAGTNEDVLKQAESRKDRGNELVKSKQYLRAVNQYTKSVEVMKVYCHDLDDETQAAAEAIECKCHANSALCHVKLSNWQETINSANNALRLDPSNLKAAYRMGLAYKELGEWQSATDAFKLALEIDPDNKEAKKGLKSVQSKAQKEKAEEDAMFSNMIGSIL
eukprot:TRINITY_DN2336_c0_g1_i1.p1 TRINITY_DN2336_c0_g1~~TRINITY_DN2336_c0_g1_i1.p1  ORF type:complete len:213 (-),score=82.62 TRINITY_DN2336_c0_g1_i1:79-717(-)